MITKFKQNINKNIKNYDNYKNYKIAIAGNPNVGKSTIFNALTGLKQHTGNWPGKTIERAQGKFIYKNNIFNFIDIPGTYSLLSNSPEEEIARDFICFEKPDAIIIILDSTCIERNLNLVLQILELTQNVVICLNLIDEAQKKNIFIDTDELSLQLGGVPVITTNARKKNGLENLLVQTQKICEKKTKTFNIQNNIKYNNYIENSVKIIRENININNNLNINPRWLSLKLLENNPNFNNKIKKYINYDNIQDIISSQINILSEKITDFKDEIIKNIINHSERIFKLCVKEKNQNYDKHDRFFDKLLTSPVTGFPIMILLFLVIFWITITGANYPSDLISNLLFNFEEKLICFFDFIKIPETITSVLISGVYRTLAWVVSVMLPPMAIFFPLFTFLEDIGYLPRIAFNLDYLFKKCGSHGKQSLTMCMGFGCNACGITGCRIIDSPRERLISILTNNFVPCNGRFPILISIISMFLITSHHSNFNFLLSSIILTSIIIFSVLITFIVSKILSKTILSGVQSSFALELPPYRKPQLSKILVRSLFDRTIYILGRAVSVATPAGLIIWLFANIHINNISLLLHVSNFLAPFAKLIGLDGVILMAFILGFPANEIVFPIIIMSYMSGNKLINLQSTAELHNLLISHNWTPVTAICVILFTLMHFPCGTTLWTIKKETNSVKYTVLAFVLPTLIGFIICFFASNLLKLFL